jgi:perosamine synthetase
MQNNKIIKHSCPTLGNEELVAVNEVISSLEVGPGKKCVEFENEFKRYIRKKHALTVNSGMAALHSALFGLGISKGDEIILPSLVCEALLFSILHTGATPVIVDIDDNGNIDTNCVRKGLSDNTKAILVPHLFGLIADIEELCSQGVPVIEDCAMSLGAEKDGKKAGEFGLISIFSFYATKMICTGQGGMVTTDDEAISKKILGFRSYKNQLEPGFNYEMDDISAAMGICQIRKIDQFVSRRKEIALLYEKLFLSNRVFSDKIILPNISNSSCYRYVIRIKSNNRDYIKKAMHEKGIECGFGVIRPLHLTFPKYSPYDCQKAAVLSNSFLSLPIYPNLTNEEVHDVTDTLLKILSNS